MIPRLIDAKYIDEYKIYICFSDGTEGEINFKPELKGKIFEPLKDIVFFKKFIIDPEIHTIIWPNGADFAPEFLYENIKIPA